MIALISNIIVAIIIIALITLAIVLLKKSNKKDKNCCSFCHNSDCSKCKK